MFYSRTSQYGECEILHAHFMEKPPGYFIDIGAADGIRYSNTLNLIKSNWSGILVEPCHHFLKTLESNYFEHDKVNIFPGAVSNYDGTSKFHVWEKGEDSQISTIVKEQYEGIKKSEWFSRMGKFTDEYWVDVLKPTSLFKKFNVPKYIEFIDLDAEGSEMHILEAWPWDDYEVELFCIEFSMGKDVVNDFMSKKGYVQWIETGGNIFYCKEERKQEINNNFMSNLEKLK